MRSPETMAPASMTAPMLPVLRCRIEHESLGLARGGAAGGGHATPRCGTGLGVSAPAPDEAASDGDLARAVSQGAGEAAEAELAGRFVRRVFLYGVRHLRDESRADDLAQDVMTSVIEKLRAGQVREPDRIGSFILGTARWMARDQQRREHRTKAVEDEAGRQQDDRAELRDRSDVDRVARALGELSERERMVVISSFHQDHTAQEIGEALGLRPGHVRVIRHRALARLATLMGVDELLDGPEAT